MFRGILLLLILVNFSPFVHAGSEEDTLGFMASYFDALKNGDVGSLLNMLIDPLLKSKRMLLEHNTAYPAYLRNYYRGATMQVTAIEWKGIDMQMVIAEISFLNDDHALRCQFILRHTINGWKIAQEK
jgi:hypothetical protein